METNTTELERHPSMLGLPDKDWPRAVAVEVAKWEKLWSQWDKENVTLHDCRADHSKAVKASEDALVQAVKKGLPDPGELPEVATTRRALAFQSEKTKHARKLTDQQARKVSEVLRDHSLELFRMACDEAEDFAADYPEMIRNLSEQFDDIVKKRNNAYALLRWVERLTDGKIHYEPSFPMEGTLSLPRTHESRVWGTTSILRKLYVDQEVSES